MRLKKLKKGQILCGKIKLLGDKSLAHRAMLFGALAKGISKIGNFPNSGVINTLKKCLLQLGIQISFKNGILKIVGNDLQPFKIQNVICNCNNSATTMRLLIGALLGTKSCATIIGSKSLNKRPIRIDKIFLKNGYKNLKTNFGYLPVIIDKYTYDYKNIKNINTKYPSSQVKSSLILSSLGNKKVKIIEPIKTRNHTENMLNSIGAKIKTNGKIITIYPLKEGLKPLIGNLPGDISSAAFILVAAAIIPNSKVQINNVLLNKYRLGFISSLKNAGCKIFLKKTTSIFGENVGNIILYSPKYLKSIKINKPQQVVNMIDEFPAISIIMALAKGKSSVRNAQELRYKESDRISSIVQAYKDLGLIVKEYPDGFDVIGNKNIKDKVIIKTNKDHRIAIAFSLLKLISNIKIDNYKIINESFPNFKTIIESLII